MSKHGYSPQEQLELIAKFYEDFGEGEGAVSLEWSKIHAPRVLSVLGKLAGTAKKEKALNAPDHKLPNRWVDKTVGIPAWDFILQAVKEKLEHEVRLAAWEASKTSNSNAQSSIEAVCGDEMLEVSEVTPTGLLNGSEPSRNNDNSQVTVLDSLQTIVPQLVSIESVPPTFLGKDSTNG